MEAWLVRERERAARLDSLAAVVAAVCTAYQIPTPRAGPFILALEESIGVSGRGWLSLAFRRFDGRAAEYTWRFLCATTCGVSSAVEPKQRRPECAGFSSVLDSVLVVCSDRTLFQRIL